MLAFSGVDSAPELGEGDDTNSFKGPILPVRLELAPSFPRRRELTHNGSGSVLSMVSTLGTTRTNSAYPAV